ncbi:MAG: hypothetical protein COV35_06045 [Alphaproteobacteria bacterium CG11_big_fil_rev_8_21_14_0_20_39_49]|nr:MAG: hypothetical protein COV35_06045 [Alphaproteobacteria bacterium CG11_big_fil_rev_8_21_14_0_20_39_49]
MIENKSPDKTIHWDEVEKVLKEDFSEEKIRDILGESTDEVFRQIGEDYEGGKLKPRSPDDEHGAWYDSMFNNIYDNIRKQKNLQEDKIFNKVSESMANKEQKTFTEKYKEPFIPDTEEYYVSIDYDKITGQNYLDMAFDEMTSEEKAVIQQLEEESLAKSVHDKEIKERADCVNKPKPKRKFEIIEKDPNVSIAEAVTRRRQQQRESSASIVCR